MGKGLVRFTLPELWIEEPRTGLVPGWASLAMTFWHSQLISGSGVYNMLVY